MKRTVYLPAVLVFMLLTHPALSATITGKVIDGATKKGVPGAVVYVVKAAGKFKPDDRKVMNQINKDFFPEVLAVQAGSKVWFENGDDVKHEIYSFSPIKKFNLPLFGKGQKPQPILFDKTGVVNIGCNIHDWMAATIVVLQNPYYDTSGKDGSFVISGVPAGAYDISFFHPGGKPVTVKVKLPLAKPLNIVSKFRPVPKKQRPADDRSSGGRY